MDLKNLTGKLTEFLGKYRYAIGVLVLGLVLMLIPGRETASPAAEAESAAVSEAMTVEQQLANILSKVEGAGEVEVLLSIASGAKTLYQTDTNGTSRSDTVTVTDADRNETGLVSQVEPPVYLGAIIVCRGADDPTVKLAIVDAVAKYTGLGTHQISVLKMK